MLAVASSGPSSPPPFGELDPVAPGTTHHRFAGYKLAERPFGPTAKVVSGAQVNPAEGLGAQKPLRTRSETRTGSVSRLHPTGN